MENGMANASGRVDLEVGDRVRLEMPWSEACAFLKVAGQILEVEVRENGAQLHKGGQPFSFPITWGEAELYRDPETGKPYTYNAEKITG